ncbi:MAG TPA: coenzyme F420-0:L-glutamate ligase [Thermomicrobiaceae bacterium]|nr:coenzyme F420-0:L-glutamate ligase [Thermomicrobiaceae bacterium]
MSAEVRVIGVDGIPEAHPGDDPAALIAAGLEQSGLSLEPGDVVVVTQKFVSKAEGRLVNLADIEPSSFATMWAERFGKDARQVEVVLRESARIVRMDRGLIIAQTPHGLVCANAGVDASNVAGSAAVSLLPIDSDESARAIRQRLAERFGFEAAVIITDSFGRPWRRGIVNIAIGSAGINPLLDYRGQFDEFGYELHATTMAIVDEIASAAELVMGKLDRRPVALVRGYAYQAGEEGVGATTLVREPESDLFR